MDNASQESLRFGGYAALAIIPATSTTGEGDDEEAEERKGRCKDYCHGRQRSSLFLI